jgi:hypothetical protein
MQHVFLSLFCIIMVLTEFPCVQKTSLGLRVPRRPKPSPIKAGMQESPVLTTWNLMALRSSHDNLCMSFMNLRPIIYLAEGCIAMQEGTNRYTIDSIMS